MSTLIENTASDMHLDFSRLLGGLRQYLINDFGRAHRCGHSIALTFRSERNARISRKAIKRTNKIRFHA